MWEKRLQLLFGGLCTVAAGLIAKRFGPAVGGLFLAFPTIFPAGASLLEAHEQRKMAKAGSGIPAFGDPGDDDVDSWKLVAFIRHLPQLTDAEGTEMQHLNPKSPDEIKEEKEEEDFLKGDAESATPATSMHHH